ncbi:MAG: 2-oxoglutarate dehydrogenase E1 component [Chlamydiia bacterium]|nr:2-oxoglutarate dehydrogenase E1 component [Chlamydiia bacterium]MCH9615528.1 2-oxoglutarate dehydrogenase E1 component [Chlamydiia bacterium]MCH9629183.1 2-oxoglutarate dehydrogenase E1 component [Chlamydiia bacterium]
MEPFDFANLSNVAYIESLYSQYLEDPESVDLSWRQFFQGMVFATQEKVGVEGSCDRERIAGVINAYRQFGHLIAHSNSYREKEDVEELSLERLGFTEADLQRVFPTPEGSKATLQEIIQGLEERYCGSIGYEFMQVRYEKLVEAEKMHFTNEQKKAILFDLYRAKNLEEYMNMKYPGQTRFSIEGLDSVLPLIREMVDVFGAVGGEEIVFGMAHRGRINILAHIMGKDYSDIFYEYEPTYMPEFEGVSDDVSYHKGFKADIKTPSGGSVLVEMLANPSHLESVNPAIAGYAKARQKRREKPEEVMPLVIHGDSAMSGQGIVYETMQLSQVEGFETKGTIHISLNNQVGFTTEHKEERSTRYSTDIARAFESPVFHVNAEDVEACLFTAQLAVKLRQAYGCDVFIELNGYRKYGHNEGDEPRFTNPKLYEKIKSRSNALTLYRDQLLESGVVTHEEIEAFEEDLQRKFNEAYEKIKGFVREPKKAPVQEGQPPETWVLEAELRDIATSISTIPEGLEIHSKVRRLITERGKALDAKIDWGLAEHLAFATILKSGGNIRLVGQDSRRATFAHRHATLIDQKTENTYIPLQHLSEDQGDFDVYNSILSEYGVVGFEYGYNLEDPSGLCIWEAQYGDFANGATIYFDQYLTECEEKWQIVSSLVFFLPHGNEGKGPEHTKGLLERFLQMAGSDNIRIANPSTPAQFFHLLRRQYLWEQKKPLFIMTPKALLRYPPSLSSLEDFTSKGFEPIILDPHFEAKKLILCSGKVYYDLLETKIEDAAIVRLEQLYPLIGFDEIFSKYPKIEKCLWVQEEHQNIGAWDYIRPHIERNLPENVPLKYVGRKRCGTTAAGSMYLHNLQKQAYLKEAQE